ncbi:hypothetical protein [Hyalangium versicolor]|uniref:hypothetical protein n=1 Tax=Hyalangium versicolor TaxID=2861190 RepID=UPI001CCD1B7A|nr:hypothetical protein [Hyalangium versicolor]
MKRLRLKRLAAPDLPSTPAAVEGPLFQLLDAPEEYDRDNDRMMAGALRLPTSQVEVPLFWDHSHRDPDASCRVPVGRAEILWAEGMPYMRPRFDRIGALSNEVADKVEVGTIDAASIGYITHRAAPNERGGEDVYEAELVEVSLTGIGAKRSALRVKSLNRRKAQMSTKARRWKSAEEAQAGMEKMAADLEALRTELTSLAQHVATILRMVEGLEEPEEQPPAEEQRNGRGEPPPGAPATGEDTVAKFFRGFVTK